MIAEVDSIDAGPLSSPGYIKRCRSLPTPCGTARLGFSPLSSTSAGEYEMPGCQGARRKTGSPLLSASTRKRSHQDLTFHNPPESPRSGETKMGKKRTERKRTKRMVGVRGFEPPTPASRTQYSTRLSYTPKTTWLDHVLHKQFGPSTWAAIVRRKEGPSNAKFL